MSQVHPCRRTTRPGSHCTCGSFTKAAGAWGEFERTHDLTDITSADFLSKVGKKTKVLARLSTVAGEKGASDTVRDIRGFALKLFTDEGNHDIVGNDLPVFFIRDPVKFPSLNRSHKRHPQTNVADSSMFWDHHNNNQEGIHCLMQLFGPRGIPASLCNIGFFGVEPDGAFKYVKIHFKPDAGVTTLDDKEAARLAGEEPDYHVKDLYNAIESWIPRKPRLTASTSSMRPRYGAIGSSKHSDYPLVPVGKLTLNKNPDNYFQDVEQAAFSPSTLVPGIGPSADILLQARMFSYPDAARYRVGPNYQQLPPNRAKYVYSPYQRDGPATINGNYVSKFTSEVEEADFEQSRELWKIYLKAGTDQVFIDNVSGHLKKAIPEVQKKTIKMFARVDEDTSNRIEKKLSEQDAGPDHVKAPNDAAGSSPAFLHLFYTLARTYPFLNMILNRIEVDRMVSLKWHH
ncbi:catalase-like domain-containing protein [Massariosphaeria phaeospora]|uniref:Catalase-like domain-containing protein n=1 Tax=Massariosphaeria phaeospora TaxID=100035 RepID=A0A7C8MI10_9PLEO|nr:catalase-like domain-containing protein [Massariosphaeria phaeospora]